MSNTLKYAVSEKTFTNLLLVIACFIFSNRFFSGLPSTATEPNPAVFISAKWIFCRKIFCGAY